MSITAVVLALVLAACGASGDNNINDNKNNNVTNGEQQEQADTNNNNEANDNNENNANDEATNDDGANNDRPDIEKTMQDRWDELPYTNFYLHVTYDDSEYLLDLTYRNEIVNILLKDDENDVHVRGRDAFDKVHPFFKELTLDENADDTEAVDEILETFDLNDDYADFELEVEFDSGATLEVEE